MSLEDIVIADLKHTFIVLLMLFMFQIDDFFRKRQIK